MSVARWGDELDHSDPARTVLVLPGGRYGVDRPGLAWPARALAVQGWQVWAAAWDLPVDRPRADRQAVVDHAVDDFVQQVGDRPRLVLAKSVGTLTAGWVADHDVPAIWTTPLLDDPVCVAHIARASSNALLVAGTRDHTWDDDGAARTGKPVCRVPGADHGWQTGQWRTELDAVGALTEAVDAFAAVLVRDGW